MRMRLLRCLVMQGVELLSKSVDGISWDAHAVPILEESRKVGFWCTVVGCGAVCLLHLIGKCASCVLKLRDLCPAACAVLYCVTPVCVLRENHRARRSCDRGRREEVGEMPLMKRGERRNNCK